MTKKDFTALLKEVNKKSSNNNIFQISMVMTNIYFTKYYGGEEHDLIKKKYADYMFAYLLEFLNDSKNLNDDMLKTNIIESFMAEIKSKTKKYRESIYSAWRKCVLENRIHENKIVESFLFFNPTLKNCDNVRIQLGL